MFRGCRNVNVMKTRESKENIMKCKINSYYALKRIEPALTKITDMFFAKQIGKTKEVRKLLQGTL